MLLEVKSEAGGQCAETEGKANSNAITAEEYAEWSKAIDRVGVKEEVLDAISAIRKSLRAVNVDEAAERRHVYVSDRRWKNIMRLLRTSAFMQDRAEVAVCDLLPIYHCLWQEPEERDAIRALVILHFKIVSGLAKRT